MRCERCGDESKLLIIFLQQQVLKWFIHLTSQQYANNTNVFLCIYLLKNETPYNLSVYIYDIYVLEGSHLQVVLSPVLTPETPFINLK